MSAITLAAPADFHVHVRQGAMCQLVTPHVAQGGIRTAYVMIECAMELRACFVDMGYWGRDADPNLVPPITTTERALEYREELRALSPDVEWLMTLYLHPDITPDEIKKAAAAGVRGVKSYPRGVTTNSSAGIEDYGVYYPIFSAMEEAGMVLNLHGEVPSDAAKNISILNAEKLFLDHLRKLAADFPNLRIVLEHATTAEAIECVTSLPQNVACTITAHHLYLTIDDVAGQPYHFCKPVAKEPRDRAALQNATKSGNPKFFLGSDSAPHPSTSKTPSIAQDAAPTSCAAGVYTSPFLVPLVASLLESFGALEQLEGFVSANGRKFYGAPAQQGQEVRLRKTVDGGRVPGVITGQGVEVVPFFAGKALGWEIV